MMVIKAMLECNDDDNVDNNSSGGDYDEGDNNGVDLLVRWYLDKAA